MILLAYYLVLSATTFAFYAADKRAAKQNRWRIAENVLHTLALLGGWPGALFAQRRLRHKTKKASFQTAFWITVALHLVIAVFITLSLLNSPMLAPPGASSPDFAPSDR